MSLRASLSLLLACIVLPAQVAEKPLSNTDVVNMINAGVPEGTIILTIQVNGDRENTAFDTSPAALIGLKNAGASEPILNTVLTSPNVQRYQPSTAVPGLPGARGLYYQSAAGWSSLDSVLVWPQITNQWKYNWDNPFKADHARDRRVYAVDGSRARVRVAGPRPALYLREQKPQQGWYLLRLNSRMDRREAVATIPDVFSGAYSNQHRMKFDTGDPVRLEPTTNAGDVVSLRPAADLMPGQYMMFKFAPGQTMLMEGYAFEVSGS